VREVSSSRPDQHAGEDRPEVDPYSEADADDEGTFCHERDKTREPSLGFARDMLLNTDEHRWEALGAIGVLSKIGIVKGQLSNPDVKMKTVS
jgi:hypothetical protein